MRRRFSWFVLVMILAAAAAPLRASSLPVIQVAVAGVELCEQATCGAAVFAGVFKGLIGGRFAVGAIAFAVTHQTPLPGPGETKFVTGGLWKMQTLSGKVFSGFVVPGGTLHNNSDGTFSVEADMQITEGGIGGLTAAITLNHNTFPPTVWGFITP